MTGEVYGIPINPQAEQAPSVVDALLYPVQAAAEAYAPMQKWWANNVVTNDAPVTRLYQDIRTRTGTDESLPTDILLSLVDPQDPLTWLPVAGKGLKALGSLALAAKHARNIASVAKGRGVIYPEAAGLGAAALGAIDKNFAKPLLREQVLPALHVSAANLMDVARVPGEKHALYSADKALDANTGYMTAGGGHLGPGLYTTENPLYSGKYIQEAIRMASGNPAIAKGTEPVWQHYVMPSSADLASDKRLLDLGVSLGDLATINPEIYDRLAYPLQLPKSQHLPGLDKFWNASPDDALAEQHRKITASNLNRMMGHTLGANGETPTVGTALSIIRNNNYIDTRTAVPASVPTRAVNAKVRRDLANYIQSLGVVGAKNPQGVYGNVPAFETVFYDASVAPMVSSVPIHPPKTPSELQDLLEYIAEYAPPRPDGGLSLASHLKKINEARRVK